MRRRALARITAGVADYESATAWAQEMDDKYLLCRDMGHTWQPFTASFDTSMSCYLRVLRCRRCRTERHQSLSMRGAIIGSNYVYPEGYVAPQGTGRIDSDGRSALRLVSVLRNVENESERR